MEFQSKSFSFTPRPIPVPGDLRIAWRVSVISLILGRSRAKRASLAKLHLINAALLSDNFRIALEKACEEDDTAPLPMFRVEPAFGRAVDFFVGEGFGGWTKTENRAALQLTKAGIQVFEVVEKSSDTLINERAIISNLSAQINETRMTKFLRFSRGAK